MSKLTESEKIPSRQATNLDYDHHRTSAEENNTMFSKMHTGCPVLHSKAHDGFYILAGYRDVRAAALDWQSMSSASGVLLPRMAEGIVVLETDPPEHTQWRTLLQQMFLPKVLNAYRPKIEAIADQLIDGFADKGRCDLVTDYAELLPIVAFFGLLGLGDKDPKEIFKLGSELTASMQDPALYSQVFSRVAPMALEELHKRRSNPGDDFLSAFATAKINGQLIDEHEFIKLIAGFVTAGHESTATGISSLLFHVLSRPELREKIGSDPQLETAAVEESLRINSPFVSFFRHSTRSQTIQGVEIPESAPVMLCWGAANRDPEAFENPEEFRLDRRNQHVAFGYGPHNCAGAPLARMEMRIALSAVLRRLPQIKLEADELKSTIYGGVFLKAVSLPASFPV